MRRETVAAFLAGHHPGDTGARGSSKGPCAIAGMFGCAPAAASEEYGSPWYPRFSSLRIVAITAVCFSLSVEAAPIVAAAKIAVPGEAVEPFDADRRLSSDNS